LQADRDAAAIQLAHSHGGVQALIQAKNRLAIELHETRCLMEGSEREDDRLRAKEAALVQTCADAAEQMRERASAKEAEAAQLRTQLAGFPTPVGYPHYPYLYPLTPDP
jgi:hypothetical protein